MLLNSPSTIHSQLSAARGMRYGSGAVAAWTPAFSAAGSDLPSQTWQGIGFGNGKYVAVNSTGALGVDRILLSTDGIAWAQPTTNGGGTIGYKSPAYGNGIWVAIANTASYGAYSVDDGVNWSIIGLGIGTSYLSSVCFGAGLFVGVGTSGRVATSADGNSWTARTAAAANTWASICRGADEFVAVSTTGTGTRVMYSADGITWSNTSVSYPEDASWRQVAYGNGRYVAVNNTGSVARAMYSTDGIAWTAGDLDLSKLWNSIAFGNGYFVALTSGSSSDVAYSTDGAAWLYGAMPSVGTWRPITHGDRGFVALQLTAANGSAISP